MAGVYLHIPFCRQACTYCDFYFSTQLRSRPELVDALVKEIGLRSSYLDTNVLESVYFGGGTPSLLSEKELELIFGALQSRFSWEKDAEITLEANPDDIRPELLKAWQNLGINRLSIGLQSFNDQELRWMNRTHTATESIASVKMAQDAGFGNITIDLIYGSKFQSLKSWAETLERTIALNTQHISSYNLTIEDETVLGLKYSRGKEPAVSDTLSSAQFLKMSELLTQAGFEHYEISNFGKPGFFAKHNSNYWLQRSYLGIGPSAHSFNGHSRQWNVKNNAQYIQALNEDHVPFEKEELTVNDRYNEYVLTRLRTSFGCDVNEIGQWFGKELLAYFKKGVELKAQYFQEKNGVYVLNAEGRLLADGLASELFV